VESTHPLGKISDADLEKKMKHIVAVSKAVERARSDLAATPTYQNAVILQRRRRERDELIATLPPLKLVA
jgi:hypothetical protein